VSDYWRRRSPDGRERLMAGTVGAAVGVSVGLLAFYLARVALGRDRLRLEPPDERGSGERE